MEQFKSINYEQAVKKCRIIIAFTLFVAIFIPIAALTGVLKPETELINIWFQRSGSIIVILSSLAEYYSIKMHNVFSPVHITNEPTFNVKLKYSLQAKKLMAISAFFIFVGTIIWGYGDLFFYAV